MPCVHVVVWGRGSFALCPTKEKGGSNGNDLPDFRDKLLPVPLVAELGIG